MKSFTKETQYSCYLQVYLQEDVIFKVGNILHIENCDIKSFGNEQQLIIGSKTKFSIDDTIIKTKHQLERFKLFHLATITKKYD